MKRILRHFSSRPYSTTGQSASAKKIIYGISSWPQMRYSNAFYADKTNYIRMMESSGPYISLSRPSRFGKSLLCDQLAAYYDLLSAGGELGDKVNELFRDTSLGNKPTSGKGQFLVFRLNFSAVAIEGNFALNFQDYINKQIQNFSTRYAVYDPILRGHIQINPNNHLDSFQQLLNVVSNSNKKLFVIIDDFDSFINRSIFDISSTRSLVGEALSQEFKNSLIPKESIMRSFGNLLKVGTSGPIEKMFITGIMPLSSCLLDVSSLNMVKDISSDPKFESVLGLNESDVNDILKTVLNVNPDLINMTPPTQTPGSIPTSRLSSSTSLASFNKIMKYMRGHFGGYRFHRDQKDELFNPQLCINFLDKLSDQYLPTNSDIDGSYPPTDEVNTGGGSPIIKLAPYTYDGDVIAKDKAIRIKYDQNIIGPNVNAVNIAELLMNNDSTNMCECGHYYWTGKTFNKKAALESLYKSAFYHGFLTYAKPISSSSNSVVKLNEKGIFINSNYNSIGALVIPNFAMKRLYLDNIAKDLPSDLIDNMYNLSNEKNLNKKKSLLRDLTQTVKSKLLDPDVQSAVLLSLERLF